ncbi:PIN domain-containing protein [Pedobacter sp. HMF7647]|uniref:PIN domain-containing protein n=1 Tax=Hufsiella arboris TaxID=2695275 RepID=A0A7K1Y860_9SPHI|nr:type II toxin-antitoxin system VapC family toxin [Hufsiella arboris]MXV50766.1 PIN domain-containing protein [Hufsiella arboris]
MSKYLLDTHAIIWFAENDQQLSRNAVKIIENADNEINVSIASLWEIAVKVSIGKLKINKEIEKIVTLLEDNQINLLPIRPTHIAAYINLPLFHKDPFDRLIISQAISEQLTVISKDEHFSLYKVPINW